MMRRNVLAIVITLMLSVSAFADWDVQHIREGQDALLQQVIALAQKPNAVVVFDLDSTLFDPRPRYVKILKEYGKQHHLPKVAKLNATKVPSSWFSDEDLLAAGIPRDKIDDFRKFWKERFFTNDYVIFDTALPGAADYVNRLYNSGAKIAYQSGRNEQMRAGTLTSLVQSGFPTGKRTELFLKPDVSMPDPDFKKSVIKSLKASGKVVALFDNEPENVNIFAKGLPKTLVIFVNTDHSPKKIVPDTQIPWVDGFMMKNS